MNNGEMNREKKIVSEIVHNIKLSGGAGNQNILLANCQKVKAFYLTMLKLKNTKKFAIN